jgi:signal transduction histidine kinase
MEGPAMLTIQDSIVSSASVSVHGRGLPRFQPGLRLQIVLALAGLMLLAFVPLFFAVASLTRATVSDARERAVRSIGQVIAGHVAEARDRGGPSTIERTLQADVQAADIVAACVFALDGNELACAGPPMNAPLATRSHASAGQFVTQSRGLVVVTQPRNDDLAGRGTPLVRLVALYMVTFALALLVFAYFVLTRLIVRPVEQLVDAADRVANGARSLRVPRSGARELIELGASVQAMTERLIHEEAALILKVEELTQTTTRLTETQAQLVRSERMASVGRLAAGVAHEIGNPIAALMGMQDLLIEGQLPPDTQGDFLQRMRRETERIHAVVRDLLDFARPEERARPEVTGVSDVHAVVSDVVALVRPQKSFQDVRVEVDVEQSLRARMVAGRLTQVLLNIVLNAGAAIASSKRRAGQVLIRARNVGGQVRVEVQDDGPGIAREVRERLFEPFVTTKDVGEGIGLGLAVCRGLVESAGGEVGVDWSCDAGARFYVVLPLAPPS